MSDPGASGLGATLNPPREGGLDSQNSTGPERLKAKHEEIKRRGTPAGAKRGPYKTGGLAPSPGVSGGSPAPVLPNWNFENTRAVCETPFEFAALYRDKQGWRLSEQDAQRVIPFTVPVLNMYVPLEGKWTALSLCALAWLKVIGGKILQDVAHEKALALEREAQKKANKSPSQETPAEVSAASVGPLSPSKVIVQ